MNRIERERYIARVGFYSSDISIWGQYDTLFEFVFEEFPKTQRQFEEIALPLLSVLSHGIELGLKENIKYFRKYHQSEHLTKFDNWQQLIKSHELESLSEEFKIGYNKLHKRVSASEEDKLEFNKYFRSLEDLINILNRDTETYRYSVKLDKHGEAAKPSINHDVKIDFIKIKELFDLVKILLLHVSDSLAIYTDYIDYVNETPDYKKGKGFLYCSRLLYTKDFLDIVKESLSEKMILVKDNMWFNQDTGENYEIQTLNDYIYIIAIHPK